MHEVLVNRLGNLNLPRKSVVRLTDRPDMTIDVYLGRKTTIQQQKQPDCELIKMRFFFFFVRIYSTEFSIKCNSKQMWILDILFVTFSN